MIPTTYPDASEIARLTARMLLEIGAVNFNTDEPYTLASGLPSPSYIDCRKLISYPRIRSTLMDFLTITVMRNAGFEAFDNIRIVSGDSSCAGDDDDWIEPVNLQLMPHPKLSETKRKILLTDYAAKNDVIELLQMG